MDDAKTTTMSQAALTTLADSFLRKLGVPEEQARQATQILVLADMMGLHTHGVSRLISYGERLRIGGITAAPSMTLHEMAPAMAVLDGGNGLGPAIGARALEEAKRIARTTGIAAVFVKRSNHFGPIAPYSWLAAREGFASFIGSNASTSIAPTGGTQTRLGNNPLGFGFPTPSRDPIILDMAMSVVARAKIRDAKAAGEPIPESWATDAKGQPTTDPSEALKGFLQPMGGYKGYGLSLCVDLMAGLLSGASYLTRVNSWIDKPEVAQGLGHSFILIDTSRLMPEDELQNRMSDFSGIIHETTDADPEIPVMLPGERELARMHLAQTRGIELPRSLIGKLQA